MSIQNINLSNLDGRYVTTAKAGLVSVTNSTGDAATILAAITAQTTGGKPSGSFETTQGTIARISSPTTITLGYSNTQNANWATDTTTEKVKLKLDIIPDAGLGSALTIKGGYGVEIDINVLGGGTRGVATDATVSAGSTTVSSPTAIAAGLAPGAVVFINGAGPVPEGIVQPRAATVRTVNSGAGTFTISESAETAVSNASMTWFDVAVRLEDMVGAKVSINAKGYSGYVLAADATDDVTKRIRASEIPSVIANGNGGTIFWKSIEAFGMFGLVLSDSVYGDYFGQLADTHCDHYEGGITQPTSQLARSYAWFDRCGYLNTWSMSVGDRANEAAILMTGNTGSNVGSMGTFTQIRATMYQAVGSGATITSGSNQITGVVSSSLTFKVGQTFLANGIPDGTTITAVTGSGNGYTAGAPGTLTLSQNATATSTNQGVYGATSDGLKLIGVQGVTINNLATARAVAGLRVIGGGQLGIKVGKHSSFTSDFNPLVVEAGTTAVPRVEVDADYRYHGGYSAILKSGLSSGADIRLRGYIEGAHSFDGGASGKYFATSASSAAVLDIAGLHQKAATGAAGLIDATTITLRGTQAARLDNSVPSTGQVYITDGAGGFTLGTVPAGGALAVGSSQITVSNTTASTLVTGAYTVPANSVQAGTTYRIKAWGTIDNDAGATVTLRARIGGVAGTSVATPHAITNASAKTIQGWNAELLLQFRATASSATPVSVGGQSYAATSGGTQSQGAASSTVNMTVNRDIGIDATWSAATATNIIRCEGYTIDKIN